VLIIIPSIGNNKTIKKDKASLLVPTTIHPKKPANTTIKAVVITIIRAVLVQLIRRLAKNSIKYGIDIKAHNTPLTDQKGIDPSVVLIDSPVMLSCNILLSKNPTIKIALVAQIKFFCEFFIYAPLIPQREKLFLLIIWFLSGIYLCF
jgi:hypothetical protein